MKTKTNSLSTLFFAGIGLAIAAVVVTAMVGSSKKGGLEDQHSWLDLEKMDTHQLTEIMDQHVAKEQYEKAAAIRDLIKRKKTLIS